MSYAGINQSDITKLKQSMYFTVGVRADPKLQATLCDTNIFAQSVNQATTKSLSKIKGFSEVKVEKIKDAVRKCLVSP